MSENHLQDVARAFPGKRVLVAGDLMMDEYIMGSVRRISPEAPVPVVEIQKRTYVPGGAANTAANVAGVYARLRDDIKNDSSIAPGFDHAVRLTRLVDDMLEASRSGQRKPAADWPRP